MGVRKLMGLIGDKCVADEKGSGVQTTHFTMLRGKTVVVDASIYMYKFKQDGVFAELFYNFVSTMRHYGVTLVFVFDGKPSENKRTTITERREFRNNSGTQHSALVGTINSMKDQIGELEKVSGTSSLMIRKMKQDIGKLEKQAATLRRSAVSLDSKDFVVAKRILDVMGIYHVTPDHEADPLCVRFVTSGIAYACMSEDTDMFVYGCTRIIRSVNVFARKCTVYTTGTILKNLGTPHTTFQAITFMAGNDYGKTNHGIHDAFKVRHKCKSDDQFIEYVKSILANSGLSYQSMIDEYNVSSCEGDIDGYARTHHSLRCEWPCVKEVMRDYGFIYVS
jgi:5'-3' exonuclease